MILFYFRRYLWKLVVSLIPPHQRFGDIKHTTRFINTVWNKKSFQILYVLIVWSIYHRCIYMQSWTEVLFLSDRGQRLMDSALHENRNMSARVSSSSSDILSWKIIIGGTMIRYCLIGWSWLSFKTHPVAVHILHFTAFQYSTLQIQIHYRHE